MNALDKAASQMSGVWAMAFDLDGWRERLDRSAEGVFGSFNAVFITAPLIALYSITARRAAQRMPDHAESIYNIAPPAPLVIGDLILFAIDWGAGLALLIMLSRSLGAQKSAGALIVGYNWSQPVTTAIQLPPIALAAATASPSVAGLLGFPALALAIAILWGVVRRGLSVAVGPAAAVVAMLIVASAVIRALGGEALRALIAA